MANQQHLAVLRAGAVIWMDWKKKNPEIEPDFSGGNLYQAQLMEMDLSAANFSVTNLSGANLTQANLSDANLIGANLSDANLNSANLSDANLIGADLWRAILGSRAKLLSSGVRVIVNWVNAHG